jgi:23S rRNA (guanosine2251-2'-O)-methyltransferase
MPAIYGRHPVIEALRSGRPVERLYLLAGARPGRLTDLLQLAEQRGIPCQRVDRSQLDRLTEGVNHQGVVAEVAPFHYRSLDDLLAAGAAGPGLPLILVLDTLEDPQNFGTLLRTADQVAATGAVIPLHRAVGVTPAVEKASAGAVEFVPVARVTNLVRALTELKAAGYWVVGLDAAGRTSYAEFAVDVPLAVVVGAEGRGLGKLVRETCDLLVRLPMCGHLDSLNAAVAGSIVLYEILRRRGGCPSGE